MAHKKLLKAPFNGMDFIWNIDDKVGTQTTERNDANDVLLIKLLLDIILTNSPTVLDIDIGCRAKPVINDRMDQGLGFWIYASQVEIKDVIVDGFISPSRGSPNASFMIFRLNGGANFASKTLWENLPNSPLCSPSLKAQLLAPPRTS